MHGTESVYHIIGEYAIAALLGAVSRVIHRLRVLVDAVEDANEDIATLWKTFRLEAIPRAHERRKKRKIED